MSLEQPGPSPEESKLHPNELQPLVNKLDELLDGVSLDLEDPVFDELNSRTVEFTHPDTGIPSSYIRVSEDVYEGGNSYELVIGKVNDELSQHDEDTDVYNVVDLKIEIGEDGKTGRHEYGDRIDIYKNGARIKTPLREEISKLVRAKDEETSKEILRNLMEKYLSDGLSALEPDIDQRKIAEIMNILDRIDRSTMQIIEGIPEESHT